MLEFSDKNQDFHLKMSATLENIDIADDLFAEHLVSKAVPVDHFSLRILLREALLNAVTHGSGTNPAKYVHLELKVGSNETVMKVCDSGPGFPWREHKEDIDNLEEGSRGLALMKIYSDSLDFNDIGNEVIMKIHLKTAMIVADGEIDKYQDITNIVLPEQEKLQ